MTTRIRTWLHNLGAAVITGAATTALSSLGISVADIAGAKVQQLDFKQIGILCAAGGLVGLLAYLKQSPLPPEE